MNDLEVKELRGKLVPGEPVACPDCAVARAKQSRSVFDFDGDPEPAAQPVMLMQVERSLTSALPDENAVRVTHFFKCPAGHWRKHVSTAHTARYPKPFSFNIHLPNGKRATSVTNPFLWEVGDWALLAEDKVIGDFDRWFQLDQRVDDDPPRRGLKRGWWLRREHNDPRVIRTQPIFIGDDEASDPKKGFTVYRSDE